MLQPRLETAALDNQRSQWNSVILAACNHHTWKVPLPGLPCRSQGSFAREHHLPSFYPVAFHVCGWDCGRITCGTHVSPAPPAPGWVSAGIRTWDRPLWSSLEPLAFTISRRGFVPILGYANNLSRTSSWMLKKHVPRAIWHRGLGTWNNFAVGDASMGGTTSPSSSPYSGHSCG